MPGRTTSKLINRFTTILRGIVSLLSINTLYNVMTFNESFNVTPDIVMTFNVCELC